MPHFKAWTKEADREIVRTFKVRDGQVPVTLREYSKKTKSLVIRARWPWVTVQRHQGGKHDQKAHSGKGIGATVLSTGQVKLNVSKKEMRKISDQGGEAWKEFKQQARGAIDREKSKFTPEFWDAVDEHMVAKKIHKLGGWDKKTMNEIQGEAESRMIAEFELSLAAQEAGFNPSKMNKSQWLDLAEQSKKAAYSEFEHATSEMRTLAGQKLRGVKKDWMIVGKQHVLVRNGMSRKDAAQAVKAAFNSHKYEAEEHMAKKLREAGYKEEHLKGTDYTDKRRLLAEIGTGFPNPTWGIRFPGRKKRGTLGHKNLRRQIISNSTPRMRRNATHTATNPLTAKGMELWDTYMGASMKGGNDWPDLPPDTLLSSGEVPDYVTTGGAKWRGKKGR
jgi:hypothetical protein